jgi:hypothetical protein
MKFSTCAMLLTLSFLPMALQADTETEIMASFDYFEQVWAEGDLDAIRGHYQSDFIYFSETAELNMKQRIGDLGTVMEEGKDQGVLEFSDVKVRPLDDKHALAWGRSQLRFKDGTEFTALFSSVYVKTPFGWKLMFTHD